MLYPNYKIFNNKNIFITGGTGSFGSFLIKNLLKKGKPTKIIIFSRDELKQYEMENDINKIHKRASERCIICDVRDKYRLNWALINNIFGLIWENLSITPFTPKSGEQEDHMAPIAEVEIKTSTVSMVFGI